MTEKTAPNRHSNYITRGILRGERIVWSRSTLATRASCTVFRVDELAKSGLSHQSLIDALFKKQLQAEKLMKLFVFRPNVRIQEALENPLLLGVSYG